jgi:hypothetical protein
MEAAVSRGCLSLDAIARRLGDAEQGVALANLRAHSA